MLHRKLRRWLVPPWCRRGTRRSAAELMRRAVSSADEFAEALAAMERTVNGVSIEDVARSIGIRQTGSPTGSITVTLTARDGFSEAAQLVQNEALAFNACAETLREKGLLRNNPGYLIDGSLTLDIMLVPPDDDD